MRQRVVENDIPERRLKPVKCGDFRRQLAGNGNKLIRRLLADIFPERQYHMEFASKEGLVIPKARQSRCPYP
jgi:hypothetical protein